MNESYAMKRITPFFGIILMLIFGCTKDMPDPKFVYNLEGQEFQCYVKEEVKQNPPDLFKVNFSTITGNYCEDDMLSASSTKNTEGIQFNLHHIDQGEECDIPQHNLSRNLNAGYLEAGTYDVTLSISQSVYYQGELKITKDFAKIQFEDAPSIFVHPSVTERIPDGAIWYRFHYLPRDAEKAAECQSRIREFSQAYHFRDGYYTYFTVMDQKVDVLKTNESPNLECSEGALLLNNADTSMLNSVLDIIREYPPNTNHQFYVFLKTWTGDEYIIE